MHTSMHCHSCVLLNVLKGEKDKTASVAVFLYSKHLFKHLKLNPV